MMRLGMLQFRGISIIQEEVQVIQKKLSSYMSSKRSIKQVFSPLPKQPREGSVQRIWRQRGAGIHRRRGSKEPREKPAYIWILPMFCTYLTALPLHHSEEASEMISVIRTRSRGASHLQIPWWRPYFCFQWLHSHREDFPQRVICSHDSGLSCNISHVEKTYDTGPPSIRISKYSISDARAKAIKCAQTIMWR